ncbi:MAG: hypothetical protein LWX11_06135 [Firmicutes bacterium]|nr:hypothetical protein [Bacillota bacterium]
MKGHAHCPHCHGRGVLLDPDPLSPARPCTCVKEGHSEDLGIPARYQAATLESFWEWWKLQHPREAILHQLDTARPLLEHEATPELAAKLDLILFKCTDKATGGWKDLKPAQEPEGYRALFTWTKRDRDAVDLWWLDGPPGSGRSTLAAAVLKAYSDRTGEGGKFVSVRAFSQELKDVYYDTRSFTNRDFQSERDRMEPLLRAPFLVLDDLDRMDSDIRVVRAFAQLLDHRYAEERPTLVTAGRWVTGLQSLGVDSFPLLRLDDPNLLRRLGLARRVVLRPMLERLLDAMGG